LDIKSRVDGFVEHRANFSKCNSNTLIVIMMTVCWVVLECWYGQGSCRYVHDGWRVE